MKQNLKTSFSVDFLWKFFLTITLMAYGLSAASNLLIPIVFSVFIALLLNPVVSKMESKGMNSVLAIFIALISLTIISVGGIYYISVQAKNLILDLPDLVSRFEAFVNETLETLNSFYGFSSGDQTALIKQNADKILSSGSSFFAEAVSATSNLLTFLTLVPIYIFFILLYRKNFKEFLRQMGTKYNDSSFTEMAVEIKQMTHSYISGLIIVITIIAVLNTTGLLLLGIKYAVFMGVVSAILTVIPYIGIFIGASLPIIVALITKDSIFYPLGVIGIYAFVQFIEGNFITPNIIGNKVDVNPLAAIIALLIGGQIWGIVGMILAIPICGIMKIIFNHYEPLRPYAMLLQSNNHAHKNPDESEKLTIKKIFWKKSKS